MSPPRVFTHRRVYTHISCLRHWSTHIFPVGGLLSYGLHTHGLCIYGLHLAASIESKRKTCLTRRPDACSGTWQSTGFNANQILSTTPQLCVDACSDMCLERRYQRQHLTGVGKVRSDRCVDRCLDVFKQVFRNVLERLFGSVRRYGFRHVSKHNADSNPTRFKSNADSNPTP